MVEKAGINSFYAYVLLIVNGSLSLIFLNLDQRNRILYRTCQQVGGKIEELLFSKNLNEETLASMQFNSKEDFNSEDIVALKNNIGIFYRLDKSSKVTDHVIETSKSHSYMLNIYYYGVAILSFLGCLLIHCLTILNNFPFFHH